MNEQAQQFLQQLDPNAHAFTFQTLDDRKRKIEVVGRDGKKRLVPCLTRTMNDPLAGALIMLNILSRRGAGVYVCVNETDLHGRESVNVQRVRAVFADLDGAPLGNLARLPLQPSCILNTSPGRWQAFWWAEGVPLDQFTKLQRRLARLFAGDPAVSDLPHVIRLPGFPHQKRTPFMVTARYFRRGVRAVAQATGRLNLL